MTLTLQRCLNHPAREAVARCPECTRFFCRECITEHDERIICAECLAMLARAGAAPSTARRLPLATFGILARVAAGVLMAWFSFYLLGRTLLSMPSEFHAESLWKVGDWMGGSEGNE